MLNNTEVAFFALAFLLPLVGGGTLLYFLSRKSSAPGTGTPDARDRDPDTKA